MWKKNRIKLIKCILCGKKFSGYWNIKYCKKCLVVVRRKDALNSYYRHHEEAKKRGLAYHHKFVVEKETNPEAYKKWRKNRTLYSKKYARKIRLIVVNRYGGNPPKCACCEETEIQFLTIDHIKNDGAKHRKEIGKGRLCQWLYKKPLMPDRFQVLCWNCNLSKYYYGQCPHKSKNK